MLSWHRNVMGSCITFVEGRGYHLWELEAAVLRTRLPFCFIPKRMMLLHWHHWGFVESKQESCYYYCHLIYCLLLFAVCHYLDYLFCFATICCIFSPVYSQKDTRLISMSIFSRKQPGTSCFLLGFPSSIAHQQLEACLNSLPFSCQCSKVLCQENSYDYDSTTLNGSASWHNLLLVLKSWRKKPPLKLTHPLINHSVTLFSTARSGPLSSSTTPPRTSWGSPSQITDLGMAWWIHFWKVSTLNSIWFDSYCWWTKSCTTWDV